MRTEDFRRFENEKHKKRGIITLRAHNQPLDPKAISKAKDRHVMDCGKSKCGLCSSPRKVGKGISRFTHQELKWRNVRRKDLSLREIFLHLSIDNE